MYGLEKICVICQKICKISHKCICCAVYNKWIHLKCSKLTKNNMKIILILMIAITVNYV